MLERSEELLGEPWARVCADLVALARAGWREADLRELVPATLEIVTPGATKEPWEDLRFARLRRSFLGHLIQRGPQQQWDFAHAQMREAVLRRNLADPALVHDLHSRVADHLQHLDRTDPVRQTELMVHLIAADDPLRAAAHYSDPALTEGELAGATAALSGHVVATQDLQDTPGLAWAAALLDLPELSDQQRPILANRFIFDLDDALANQARLPTRLVLLQAAEKALSRLAPTSALAQRDLVVSYSKIGDVLLQQGDLGAALEQYRASLAIAQRLVQADPTSAQAQRDLAASWQRMAFVARQHGDQAGERQYLIQCRDVLRGMRDRGMYLDPQIAQVLDQLERLL